MSKTQQKESTKFVTMPDFLKIITSKGYGNVFNCTENDIAYLVPLKDKVNEIMEKYDSLDYVNIHEKRDDSIRRDLNSSLFDALFTIALTEYKEAKAQGKEPPVILNIKISDFARYLGSNKPGQNEMTAITSQINKCYSRIIGIIGSKRLPLVTWQGDDLDTKEVSITVPYIRELICKLDNDSTQIDKKGIVRYKPYTSTLLKPEITKVRSPDVRALVRRTVILFEQSGNNNPNIYALTLVNEIDDLREAVESSDTSYCNRKLSRVFRLFFSILPTITHIPEAYKNVVLPDPNDPNNIPKKSTLSKIKYTFYHEGKILK